MRRVNRALAAHKCVVSLCTCDTCCFPLHPDPSDWLLEGTLQRLVLVVASVASGEVLERWVFNVDTDKETCALTTPVCCA